VRTGGPISCHGNLTIPSGTAPGNYSFVWIWAFDRDPTVQGEEVIFKSLFFFRCYLFSISFCIDII